VIRTDLACEAYELHKNALPDGIRQEECFYGEIRVVSVVIENDDAGRYIGKPAGKYVTVETASFAKGTVGEGTEEAVEAIALQLKEMLPKEIERETVLVAGLGNRDITPDALGPKTAEKVLSTRHIGEELKKEMGLEQFNSVAVIATGVLAQTGVETGELIGAVTEKIQPAAVIVIDALAAMEVSRLGRTVQISDSGIVPGSGVFNSRKKIDEKLLGTKVISIGVPTVVDAATLVQEFCDGTKEKGGSEKTEKMMITPREIDVIIERAADMVAMGINRALHPEVTTEDFRFLMS